MANANDVCLSILKLDDRNWEPYFPPNEFNESIFNCKLQFNEHWGERYYHLQVTNQHRDVRFRGDVLDPNYNLIRTKYPVDNGLEKMGETDFVVVPIDVFKLMQKTGIENATRIEEALWHHYHLERYFSEDKRKKDSYRRHGHNEIIFLLDNAAEYINHAIYTTKEYKTVDQAEKDILQRLKINFGNYLALFHNTWSEAECERSKSEIVFPLDRISISTGKDVKTCVNVLYCKNNKSPGEQLLRFVLNKLVEWGECKETHCEEYDWSDRAFAAAAGIGALAAKLFAANQGVRTPPAKGLVNELKPLYQRGEYYYENISQTLPCDFIKIATFYSRCI